MCDKSINMKFDICLMNPPYDGTLHLEFLKKCLDISNQCVVVEPANSLYTNFAMQVKKHVDTEIFPKMINHTKSVTICNLNKEFNTALRLPFAITCIDYTKTYNDIKFDLYGELSVVNSLQDVNLWGKRELINWIRKQIDNIIKQTGSAADHFIPGKSSDYNRVHKKGNWYLRNSGDVTTMNGSNSEVDYVLDPVHNVKYYGYITSHYVHKNNNEITSTIQIQTKNGKELSHPNGYTYDSNKHRLENFKKFILTNNIAHYIAAINPGSWIWERKLMPYWTNDDVSEEALYNMFDQSNPELLNDAKKLIEDVCKKYQRGSNFLKQLEG